jgi:hypothetical protein
MNPRHGLTRRHLLEMAAAAGGLAVSGGITAAWAQTLKRTPGGISAPSSPSSKGSSRALT